MTPRIGAQYIAENLMARLNEGVFPDGLLPSERDLAQEFGVARLTIRRALDNLLAADLIRRLPNGRLISDAALIARGFQVGFLVPHTNSFDFSAHLQMLRNAAQIESVRIRTMVYESWHDPLLLYACENCDALILIPRPGVPLWLQKKLTGLNKPVLVIEGDLAQCGIPSFNMFIGRAVEKIMDYLRECGHNDVDLLNISGWGHVQRTRREIWREQLKKHGGKGDLFDFSLPDNTLPPEHLRDCFRRQLQNQAIHLDRVLLATAWPTAQIFVRAAADLGLQAGKDYSLALIDGETQAEYSVPSITCLERIDMTETFRRYLRWMRSGNKWDGELNCEIADYRLNPGESIIRRS